MKLAAAVAVALDERARLGSAGMAAGRSIAAGRHWSVHDVVCTCTPDDRPFEEQHAGAAIALVVAGTFQYRTPAGRALMTPGSLLLGNDRQCFRCSHEHAAGDRCVSFRFAPDWFAALAADAGTRCPEAPFASPRLALPRSLAPLVARVRAGLASGADDGWGELALALAIGVLPLITGGQPALRSAAPVHERRVTELVRHIDGHPAADYSLESLAHATGLSPFHFTRVFRGVIGVSPHQYVMRTRLQHAAGHLVDRSAKVLDVALDAGFGDVSNFNHAFRREFGVSPRAFRQSPAGRRDEDEQLNVRPTPPADPGPERA